MRLLKKRPDGHCLGNFHVYCFSTVIATVLGQFILPGSQMRELETGKVIYLYSVEVTEYSHK